MSGRAALLLAVVPLWACASFTARVRPPSEPERRFARAVAALDSSDFAAARADLEWLVSRCDAGPSGRSALLLAASAELDVRNPEGSPAEAVRLSRAYLRLPWADEREIPIARTLYLLALDRTPPGQVPPEEEPPEDTAAAAGERIPASGDRTPLAARFDHCGGGGVAERTGELPSHPGPTSVALEEELAQLTDSLTVARTRSAAQGERIRELEAEIERIRKLLRGGRGGVPSLQR